MVATLCEFVLKCAEECGAEGGGLISACVWDYAGRMDFLRFFWDVASALDPDARERDEGLRFPICRPEALTALFDQAGLRDILCEPVEVRTGFAGFDDYWQPLLGGTGPTPSSVASLEPDARALLAREFKAAVPQEPEGTISLIARAWAVRGIAG